MVALIDYGSGNIHSAARALREAASRANTTHNVTVTADPADIAAADRIVLPGVGHFADCAANLRAQPGLVDALETAVLKRAVPFLGICVGMQLMASVGREDGDTPGLGWVPGDVAKITPGAGLPVPHMGWNNIITPTNAHPVLTDLGDDPHAYFVHSYAFAPESDAHIAATTHYGQPITAAIARDNLFGTQFHPEKSQHVGLKILSNFMRWNP